MSCQRQKPFLRAPCKAGEAVDGRGNAGWMTSKSGYPCPCQNRSQWPRAEKTGRQSLLNRTFISPWSVKGLNWTKQSQRNISGRRQRDRETERRGGRRWGWGHGYWDTQTSQAHSPQVHHPCGTGVMEASRGVSGVQVCTAAVSLMKAARGVYRQWTVHRYKHLWPSLQFWVPRQFARTDNEWPCLAFSSLTGVWGECSTIHFPPAFFFFQWRVARAH